MCHPSLEARWLLGHHSIPISSAHCPDIDPYVLKGTPGFSMWHTFLLNIGET